MSQAKTPGLNADNGHSFPSSVYHKSGRATGNQRWVADKWAEGALPVHSTSGKAVKLYTSTGNFTGLQYPSGRGKLKHYRHIQAIRTKSGLIIGDSSCWARGMAKCTYPRNEDGRIDLTSLKSHLRTEEESIYDIEQVDGDEVTFGSGRVISLDGFKWVKATPQAIDSDVLGL